MSGRRLTTGVERGRPVTLLVDGAQIEAFEGESIAAALLADGRRVLRYSPREHEPRGLFCGMGICFECVVAIDGDRRVRGCVTPVRDGMTIATRG
ncbi:MAG: (2Fe-2S)-binding protein [Vicinamibacterales bacterium]